MAKDKKSFLIYCDIIHTIDHLTNEEKGILFQHLLEYVNDMNPILTDRLLLTAWKPIERQLKRDLQKYENVRERNKENARIRWGKNNATACDRIPKVPKSTKNADNDIVIDNDIDTVRDINKIKHTATPFSFFNSLVSLGVKKDLANDWIKVRKTKKLTNTKTAFNNLKIEFEKSNMPINDIIEKCIIESWGGFKNSWLNKTETKKINGKEFSSNFEHPDKRPTL